MAAQKGSAMLLKATDDTGALISVAGIRTRRLSFNAKTVDITDSDSVGGWRELLTGAGLRSCSVSGGGVFRDSGADLLIRGLFFTGAGRVWQLIVPDFGSFQGVFMVTGLSYTGVHDGEITFDIGLESAGPTAFAAF